MASPFPETIRAQLAGQHVALAVLAFFDFKDDPTRVWMDYGDFRTRDGNLWKGIGKLTEISGLQRSSIGAAQAATFKLSGVDRGVVAHVRAASRDVANRWVRIYVQFLNENWQCLDNPYAIYSGRMDTIKLSVDGPDRASISLTAESLLARRTMPMWASLSDRDQKRLFPEDRGLEFVSQIPNKSAIWPIITS